MAKLNWKPVMVGELAEAKENYYYISHEVWQYLDCEMDFLAGGQGKDLEDNRRLAEEHYKNNKKKKK